MDELEFRRRLYADPNENDPLIEEFAKQDPERNQFLNDIKNLDQGISDALNIPVPENLADKLILNQAIESHKVEKKQRRVHLAIAASIAFCFSMMVTYSLQQAPIDLTSHAIAHMEHEPNSLSLDNQTLELTQVNHQLASFGGKVSQLPGKVTYSSICDFDGQKSLHLVFQTAQGPVTLFVVPSNNTIQVQSQFNHHKFDGDIYQTQQANYIMLGQKGMELKQYQKQVADSVSWEI